MKTSTHLRKARALVNKGWCKGYMHKVVDDKDCYCMFGAMDAVNYKNISPLLKYIMPIVKHYHGPVYVLTPISFNDHPKTTKKDVLAVFDLAIKKAVEDERSSNADRNK